MRLAFLVSDLIKTITFLCASMSQNITSSEILPWPPMAFCITPWHVILLCFLLSPNHYLKSPYYFPTGTNFLRAGICFFHLHFQIPGQSWTQSPQDILNEKNLTYLSWALQIISRAVLSSVIFLAVKHFLHSGKMGLTSSFLISCLWASLQFFGG